MTIGEVPNISVNEHISTIVNYSSGFDIIPCDHVTYFHSEHGPGLLVAGSSQVAAERLGKRWGSGSFCAIEQYIKLQY